MTVSKLWNETTQEEILLWSAYFGYLAKQQDKAIKEAKRRRR